MYTLHQLGWSDIFDRHFQDYSSSGFLPGRISNEQRGHYYLLSEQGELRAEASGKVLFTASSNADLPKVGDWVAYQPFNEQEGMIHAVLPRRSTLSRKDPADNVEQIIVSNVDVMFIVQGLDGDFNPRRLERYLVTARSGGAKPIVLLNKSDMLPERDTVLDSLRGIVPAEEILFLSALRDASFERIIEFVPTGTTAVLAGSSGAGKSTLLNRLLGTQAQITNAVREDDSRGRHTTTSRSMFIVPGGGIFIDTPGMRELAPWAEQSSLDAAFGDIEQLLLQCRFSNCSHINEPGCAVQAALKDGTLDPRRYKSFEKLQKELAYLNSSDSYLRQKEQLFKSYAQLNKRVYKGRKE